MKSKSSVNYDMGAKVQAPGSGYPAAPAKAASIPKRGNGAQTKSRKASGPMG